MEYSIANLAAIIELNIFYSLKTQNNNKKKLRKILHWNNIESLVSVCMDDWDVFF